MPFGAVYGILFLGVLAVWTLFMASGAVPGAPATARWFLGLLCLALCVALALRRVWARWAGVVCSAALATLLPYYLSSHAAITVFVLPIGAFVAAVLLLVPATGAFRAPAGGTSGPSRIAAVAAVVGVVGLATTVGWGSYAPPSAVAGVSPASRISPVPSERVSWTDFGAGLQLARAEGKPMLVLFEVDWCGYCRKMARTTWRHPGVVERLGELVSVRVDAEDPVRRNGFSGRELAERYGVSGYPTLLLLDADGDVLNATGGYQDPRRLLTWIEDSLNRPARTRAPAGPDV